jgi:sodium/potassium-transporting ATPase subunit alpha
MRLQLVFQAMYFGAIVVTQWANLIMSKTRRNSVFKQGMT